MGQTEVAADRHGRRTHIGPRKRRAPQGGADAAPDGAGATLAALQFRALGPKTHRVHGGWATAANDAWVHAIWCEPQAVIG